MSRFSIPGPIEVTDEVGSIVHVVNILTHTPLIQVLYANAHPSMAHSGPDFIPVFGDCIRMLRWIICAASTPQLTPRTEKFFSPRMVSHS